ncbi:MAG: hypothetical protein WC953_02350 [Pseudomonas sp.]
MDADLLQSVFYTDCSMSTAKLPHTTTLSMTALLSEDVALTVLSKVSAFGTVHNVGKNGVRQMAAVDTRSSTHPNNLKKALPNWRSIK